MWLLLHWLGPMLVTSIYEGQSFGILNNLIKGQQQHPLTEYLSLFSEWNNRIAITLIGCACMAPIILRLGIHQRSVKPVNVSVVLLMGALVIWRDPELFLVPRFWAEEATVFFKTAYTETFWNALIAPHQGYYMLWANLAGMLATVPPIEHAPIATTMMSFIVLFAILLWIIYSDSEWLDSSLEKGIACFAVLVVGATGSIWLTSINSQYYMTLLTFLVLIDNKRNPLKRRAAHAIVAITGLSSVAANFLTPLFLARYLHRKERADLSLFFILAITSTVQLTAIGYSMIVLGDSAYYHSSQIRFPSQVDVIHVVQRIAHYSLSYPIFGEAGLLGWFGTAVLLIIIIMTIHLFRDRWEFLASIFLLTTLSVIASLEMEGAPRYAYPVSVILALMLLSYVFDARVRIIIRIFSGILLATSLSYWSWHYRTEMINFRNPDWPIWSDEVNAWKQDPSRKLQAHPIWQTQTAIGLNWAVELPSKNITIQTGTSNAPPISRMSGNDSEGIHESSNSGAPK